MYFGIQRCPRMARLSIRQSATPSTLSRMDAKTNDPARVLIHDHQDPVGPQRGRLAPEQIHTPEAVFHVAQESQPGGTTGVLSRQVVMGENPSNHIFRSEEHTSELQS